MLPEIRHDIAIINKNYENLRTNYPEAFARFEAKNPQFAIYMKSAQTLAGELSDDHEELRDEDVLHFIDTYNEYAHGINGALETYRKMASEDREQTIFKAASGEIPFDENSITPEQKEMMKQAAQDIWRELFPESHVDRFVKWAGGQKNLMDIQKILIAPANGIEGVISGIINLTQPKTYQDFAASIEQFSGMSYEEYCATWRTMKFTFENLSTTDKVAPLISILTGMTLLIGGSVKMASILKKLKYPPAVLASIESILLSSRVTHFGNAGGKAAPVGVMEGVSLKYI